MKGKILTFIIGVLVGAIIATLGFNLYIKTNKNKRGYMPNGGFPQMMNQGNGENPPERPTGAQRGNRGNTTTKAADNNI